MTSHSPPRQVSPSRDKKRPLIVRFGKKARVSVNRFVSRYSMVPVQRVYSADMFPWLSQLEQAAPQIQIEADQILKHLAAVPPMNQMSPDHERIAGDGGWRSFFLVGYGYRIEANCARCPETSKALMHVPGLVTALISILEPGMHVGRHRGVSRGIMIAHLGLRVPSDGSQCRMDVDGEAVHWREGHSFVFDDTFLHEVWNDTPQHRVILLVQFRRPMRLPGRIVAGLFVLGVKLSPYIQDARRNVAYWEKQLQFSEKQTSNRGARHD